MIEFLLYSFLFLLTFVLIQIFKFFSPNLRLVDYPSKRKLHTGTIPLVGGIAIYLSIIVSLLFFEYDYLIKSIIYSSMFVVILGLIDDAFELGIIIRLTSQFIATLIVTGTGLSIINFGNYELIPEFNFYLNDEDFDKKIEQKVTTLRQRIKKLEDNHATIFEEARGIKSKVK